ncbi:hypothetical protein ACQR16_24520 [Bradyrhizobium oligotrophicum]|uniref:hypothetical protein n=1 Tax=Bradyrhizobium oligotrophicum TaxID=44255 RepID=UPI003EBA6ACB
MRRTQIGGQFAARLIEMLESPANRVMSLSARRALDRIEIELAHHGGTDNGRLPVTFDDFRRFGIDRDAIAPAIRELVALGFVEVTERGRAGNAEFRTPNKFRLTYKPAKGLPGHGTNEWRKIASVDEALAIAKGARNSKLQSGETAKFGRGNPDRKQKSPVGETPTTGHSRFSPTTIDISGRGRAQLLPTSTDAAASEVVPATKRSRRAT